MSKTKRKKHDYADLLKYMRLLDEGRTFSFIQEKYGICAAQLKVIWVKYKAVGSVGLKKNAKIKIDFALKRKIILDIAENHLTLHSAALKYGVHPITISRWSGMYRKGGWRALLNVRERSMLSDMGRPKKNSGPVTELEVLRKENERLRLENLLLKKVKALVEEREARNRAIGHGPSKN